MYLLFPLTASILFVIATMFFKQAADHGAGIWRTTFVTNLITAPLFIFLWPLGGTLPIWTDFYQPAIVAMCFLCGQVLQFLSLERGDVSIATPVLGTKILIVAGLQTILTSDPVTPVLWVSAGIAVVAVMLLNSSGGHRHHHVTFTIIASILSGACFALFDVLVQKWSPAWETGRFLPVMFCFVAAFSFVLPLFFHAPLKELSKPTWKAMIPGAILMASQALAIICGISLYGHATEMNVVYALRGLWSVAAVWMIGHWFQNTERGLGTRVMTIRMIGAALLVFAIVLMLVLNPK